jgi:hypothetical protein
MELIKILLIFIIITNSINIAGYDKKVKEFEKKMQEINRKLDKLLERKEN